MCPRARGRPDLADLTDDGQTEVPGRMKLSAAVLERLVELDLLRYRDALDLLN
jgi:hypothetical protein